MTIKPLAKKTIFLVERYISRLQSPNVSLLFHRVVPNLNHPDPESLCITVAEFDQTLSYLSKTFPLLTIDQFLAGDFGVHITFDDGYLDNYLHALPVLLKYCSPATFFITTSFVQGIAPWWDHLWSIVTKSQPHDSRYSSYEYIRNQLRPSLMTASSTHQTLAAFDPESSQELPPFMSPQHIADLSTCPGITIGCHSHAHHVSSSLTPDQFQLDLFIASSLLQTWTSFPPTTYAYPYGHRNSWSNTNIKILKSSGYTSGFSNIPGYHTKHSNQFSIRRFLISRRYPLDLDEILSPI